MWNSIPIASGSFKPGSKTDCSTTPLSGTTLEHSTGNLGLDQWILSLRDSRARTSAVAEAATDSTERNPDYGEKWHALSVKYDRDLSSWKTAHFLWEEDLPESSVRLPRWGLMRDGACYRLANSARPIYENVSGYLPTPTAADSRGRSYQYDRGNKAKARPSLLGMAKLLPTPAATDWKGQYTWETVKRRMKRTAGVRLPEELCRRVGKAIIPNPEFWEWMMGWPIGATGLQPVERDKFQQWRQQHSGS